MKNTTFVLMLTFIVSIANAQNTQNTQQATNQWIDFDKTYYKIKVAEDGIYRVDYNTLIEQGFPADFTDAKRLSLINEGQEIPMYISDSENWGEGAYLEFYGQQLDGKFDQRLYEKPEDQLHPYWSQFTDTAVYFLSYAEPSKNIIEVKNDLNNLPEKESYFKYTSVFYGSNSHSNGTIDAIIYSKIFEGEGKINSHFASYGEGEGWIGHLYAANNPLADNTHLVSINTPSVFYNDLSANITIKVQGISMDTAVVDDHHLQIRNNNELLIDDKFEDYTTKKYTFDIPVNQLNSSSTEFEFTAVQSESRVDRQAVSYITVNYPRSYDFDGVDHLAFAIENKQDGNYLEFESLSTNYDFYLYDISNLLKIKLSYNEEKGIHQGYLPVGNDGQRNLVLQNENQIKEVSNLKKTNFIDYSNRINQGDYIVISHPNLFKEGNALDNYVRYRSSMEGGAYQTLVVDVENLYDQYSYGIRKHPLAIKYFLNEAIENWDNRPSHCFLLGKAIKNSRCRAAATNWTRNLVPTFGERPNDQYFGAKDFNPLSRIAIGRLSVDNEQDIQHYLDKVIAVEQNNTTGACTYIEEAQWRHQMFHMGGGSDENQSGIFAERLTDQANIAQNGKLTAQTDFLFKNSEIEENDGCTIIDNSGLPVTETLEACLDRVFKDGIRVLNFMGHASGLFWELDIGEPEDYNYNSKYPVIISQSNFSSDVYKSYAELSMPEIWLKGKGTGAVAFIGFDFIYDMLYAADLIDGLHEQMFHLIPEATLGEQVNAAILEHYDSNDIITIHTTDQLVFSGDPALKYHLNIKPEVAIAEDNIDLTVNPIDEFNYTIEISFDFSSLNIAYEDSIPYNILLIADNTEIEVSNHWLKPGEHAMFKSEFTLQPNQSHMFRIQLDNSNQFDEICEDNNTFFFRAGDWVGIKDDLFANNTINNYPNPFSGYTTFDIVLGQSVLQQDNFLIISNLNGKKVHQIKLDKGLAKQNLNWKGTDSNGNLLPAGVYWYQLKNADSQIISAPKKIVLVR